MAVFFCVFFLHCLCRARIFLGKEGNQDYLSLQHTQIVKGIFIILVFFSHFNSYVTYTARWDVICRDLVSLFGQTMVTMFLFYSGYGVMESVRKKGRDYVDAMPGKRILSTLFRFDCAVLMFAVLALWKGDIIGPLQFVLSLIGWDSLGNSNWYIFIILVLYLMTYSTCKLSSNQKTAVTLVFLLVCAGIFCLAFWNIKPVYWYDTALCYVMGMAYSLYRKPIEEKLKNSWLTYGVVMLFLALACEFLRSYSYIAVASILRNCIFAALILILTMRISLRSRILSWCGTHLFPLYILQRIPMILLKELGLANASISVYFLCCVGGTLLLTIPFEWVTNWIWTKLQRKTLSV